MRTAIDSNILSALWSAEPLASEVAGLLGRAVYCELLARREVTGSFADGFLAETHILVDFTLDEAIWREAGLAFAGYAERRRQSGGAMARRLLADFLIGEHAQLRADQWLTLDAGRHRQGFSSLRTLP